MVGLGKIADRARQAVRGHFLYQMFFTRSHNGQKRLLLSGVVRIQQVSFIVSNLASSSSNGKGPDKERAGAYLLAIALEPRRDRGDSRGHHNAPRTREGQEHPPQLSTV